MKKNKEEIFFSCGLIFLAEGRKTTKLFQRVCFLIKKFSRIFTGQCCTVQCFPIVLSAPAAWGGDVASAALLTVTALHCTALHFTAQHCTLLNFTDQHGDAVHSAILECTTFHCITHARHCTTAVLLH